MATLEQVLVLISTLMSTKVLAYYCDSGRCNEEHEYCCGLNTCCTSYAVWQMWYFWCGLVIFVVLLMTAIWFCIYTHYSRATIIQSSTAYSRLEQQYFVHSQSQDCSRKKYLHGFPNEAMDYSPPPPYSQLEDMNKKDQGYMYMK